MEKGTTWGDTSRGEGRQCGGERPGRGWVRGSRRAPSHASKQGEWPCFDPSCPMSFRPRNGNSTRNVNVVLTEQGCEASTVIPLRLHGAYSNGSVPCDRGPVMPPPGDHVLVNGGSTRLAGDVVCVA